MGKKSLCIVNVPISAIMPYELNPREWSDKARRDLKESIKRHGFLQPVLLNKAKGRENHLISGHFRTEMAKELGMTEVPAIYVSVADPKKEAELVLRFNANVGGWNNELLQTFDIELLLDVGFTDVEIGNIWDDALTVEDDDANVEKMIEEAKKSPVAKFGDLYSLGSHRLYCNDSTDPEAVKRLVDGNEIDMVTLDPVYGIGLSYDKGVSGKARYGGAEKDAMKPDEYRKFLEIVITNALLFGKKDLHFFCWNDQVKIGLVQELLEKAGLTNRRTCLWIKSNFSPTPNVAWNKAYEPCMYSTRGTPWLNPDVKNLIEILNKNIDAGNRAIEDVVEVFDLWVAKRVSGQEMLHPTQKPLSVYEKPLRRCTKVGANVLELFSGSGTCLLACEQMKRRAFAMEKDPVFVDVCIRRFEEMTGVKAKKLN